MKSIIAALTAVGRSSWVDMAAAGKRDRATKPRHELREVGNVPSMPGNRVRGLAAKRPSFGFRRHALEQVVTRAEAIRPVPSGTAIEAAGKA
jgi:hypothetical protein